MERADYGMIARTVVPTPGALDVELPPSRSRARARIQTEMPGKRFSNQPDAVVLYFQATSEST